MEGLGSRTEGPGRPGMWARALSAQPSQGRSPPASALLPLLGPKTACGETVCPVGAAGGQERGGLRACSRETPPWPGERARSAFGPDDRPHPPFSLPRPHSCRGLRLSLETHFVVQSALSSVWRPVHAG